MLIHDAPKYGNDDDYVDNLTRDAYQVYIDEIAKYHKMCIRDRELSVVNELSIAENLFVGKLPKKTVAGIKVVDYKKMNAEAEKYMKEIGLNRSPSTLVQDISISEKQQVEIAKALASQAKIIIMDEPTSSLSIEETEDLFKIIEKLKKNGIGIIYISHKLKELKQIGDRVTVLKDGCYVNTVNVADIEVEDMIPMMVGRKIKSVYPGKSKAYDENEIAFEVKHLTRKDGTAKDISFQVHKGEILGFAGLIGAGRSECMEGIFGAKPISSGAVSYTHLDVYKRQQILYISDNQQTSDI